MRKLTALMIKSPKEVGLHCDDGATGLYLQVRQRKGGTGWARSWIFRYVSPVSRKTRWMGLGSTKDIRLAEARELAHTYRRQVRAGVDPVDARAAQRLAASAITFRQCAEAYIEAHATGWSNAEHARQWGATLAAFAYPIIGALPVSAIDTALVLRVLSPHWNDKPVTLKRVRGRIERVLDWAKVRGYREGENPARWKGHLDHLLPSPRKLKPVRHLAALPFADVPTFMAALRKQDSIAARTLEMTALTALRTSEALGATWGEFNLTARVWTVPAERMKNRREHRVPLSDRVIEILRGLPGGAAADPVFADVTGKPLHRQHAMLHVMQALRPGVTVHGLRSTFRDWAGETTNHPGFVVEMALAHSIGNAVEAAYRRGDLFEKRAILMRDWARYCASKPATANVVTLEVRR